MGLLSEQMSVPTIATPMQLVILAVASNQRTHVAMGPPSTARAGAGTSWFRKPSRKPVVNTFEVMPSSAQTPSLSSVSGPEKMAMFLLTSEMARTQLTQAVGEHH